jgi:superfamily I DNA/RNA helicase/RecB family exonuclease
MSPATSPESRLPAPGHTAGADESGRPAYRLLRTPPRSGPAPRLDDSQQAVLDTVARPGHGPVLVLAGPGTGKTTTLVESVAARVAAGGDPDRVLTLTFSRKAAADLRDRIGARLGRTVATPSAWTFHAFAYALADRARPADDPGRPLRLLSGPQQDVVVRDLLAGDLVEGTVGWPADLRVAVGTRGFADEVRALLARARTLGMEPADLLAAAGGRPDWSSAADFLAEYLAVLDARGLLDYGELVHRAVAYAATPAGRAELRSRYDLVLVDEYQDTDPAQARLLAELAGQGGDLVVVGDPDQSIYAFRGADVRGLLEFPDRFRRVDGRPATVLTLSVSRRAGAALLAASRSLATRLPLAGTGLADQLRGHRAVVAASDVPDGSVDVLTFPSPGLQLESVADLLRREHLDARTPWSDMAVLVRSGSRSVPAVRRVLGGAGVPVQTTGDELPLAREAAAAPLLLAARVVHDPAALSAEAARTLLLSPLAGADVGGLRLLGRHLREQEQLASRGPEHPMGRLPRPSAELIRQAVQDPEQLGSELAPGSRAERAAQPVLRLGRLLRRAGEVASGGAPAYDVLWALWDGTSWPRRLQRLSAGGGRAGRAADRDLDVVVALFDAAARDADRLDRPGLGVFLDELQAQQIPADTLAEQGLVGDAVRVLTAHRAKGLEWPVVIVVDVQEDIWPDLGHRGSLLQADRLGPDGVTDPLPARARLAEERRLFYVAVTRARRRLVVTAVDSPEDDGVRPSRFLAELGVPVQAVRDRPTRALTLAALVSELRATAADLTASEMLRRAAAARLATLAAASEGGRPLVPAALPERWWGVLEVSDPGVPLYPDDLALELSGSSLSGMEECPLRWFLQHEVRAGSARSAALGFGSLVHALAHDVGRGASAGDLDHLLGLLDSVWNQLAFDAPWRSDLERVHAAQALTRFLSWHESDRGREVLGTEQRFDVTVQVAGRDVRLRGSMDRVEVDADGRVHVVDLKTGKWAPTAGEIAVHPQLGVYQLAVREGAVPDRAEPGGAELVQLKAGNRDGSPKVQQQPPPEPDDAGMTWVDGMLRGAVARMVGESFPPTPGKACQYCQFHAVCPARDEGRQVLS